MSHSIRDILESEIILNDRGRPVQDSAILRCVIEAYENPDVHRLTIIAPRRSGKSQASFFLPTVEVLTRDDSYSVIASSTGDSAEAVAAQKVMGPIRKLNLGLTLSKRSVINVDRNSQIEVVNPSESGSLGRTVTGVLILDEARLADRAFAELLYPSAMTAKLTVVISSASAKTHWLYESIQSPGEGEVVRVFKSAREAENPEYDYRFLAREKARLERQGEVGQLLYQREYCSAFVDISGKRFLDFNDVQRAKKPKVAPYDPKRDRAIIGVDLATHRDLCSGIVALIRKGETEGEPARLRLIEGFVYRPQDFAGGVIDLPLVESRIESLAKRYGAMVIADAWQGTLMVQRLRARNIQIYAQQLTTPFLWNSWDKVRSLLREERLEWPEVIPGFDEQRYREELSTLIVEENKSGGLRVSDGSSGSGRRLHRDLSMAACLATAYAAENERSMFFSRELPPNLRGGPPRRETIELERPDLFDIPESVKKKREIEILEARYVESARQVLRKHTG